MKTDLALRTRSYQDENDYWRIRGFLRQVLLLNNRRELSWHVARFDYWWWRRNEFLEDTRLEEVVFIWETPDGQMAAVLNPEARGQAFLQVHPDLQSNALVREMIIQAEKQLAITRNGRRKLWIWSPMDDQLRQEILKQRGYTIVEKPDTKEHQRRLYLHEPLPDISLPPGYTVRSQGDTEEHPARGWASWRAFHPDEPDEEYGGWDWFVRTQQAPLYRRDLDIVAVDENGEYAAFSTFWFDDVTRTAYIEPVGTVPDHRRLGLGKAVLLEGLRRLKHRGAILALVTSYTPPAHALYASVGFREFVISQPWEKDWR